MAAFQEERLVANAIHKFRDRDVRRFIRANQQAGIAIAAVELDPNSGRIKIVSKDSNASTELSNPWDEVYAADQKRSA